MMINLLARGRVWLKHEASDDVLNIIVIIITFSILGVAGSVVWAVVKGLF